MDLVTIIAVALGLSFDTFAVSLSYGVIRNNIIFWQAARIAIILAVFQAGMLVLGFFLGSFINEAAKAADHWIALFLLSFLGIKMIVDGMKRGKNDEVKDYGNFLTLLPIAVGTSLDAFAVGVSFALLEFRIWYSSVILGTVTFLASMTAIRIGKSAGDRLGNRVELVGGLILIAIGIKIFLEHLLGS
jgi:manganese efflux pump family protein